MEPKEGSSSSALQANLDTARIDEGLSRWDADGQDLVKQVVISQTDPELASASTIPVTSSIIKLLQANIGAEETTKWLSSVAEDWAEERRHVFWEALVDAVVVLVEDKDDSQDVNKSEGMDVDGQQAMHAGDKGVQIIKDLLVSSFHSWFQFPRSKSNTRHSTPSPSRWSRSPRLRMFSLDSVSSLRASPSSRTTGHRSVEQQRCTTSSPSTTSCARVPKAFLLSLCS